VIEFPSAPADWAGLLCVFIVAVNLVSLGIAAFRFKPRQPILRAPADAPGVTLVRPVCGIETFSEETLRAGFLLDYPDYELIFCVADPNDPILPLVRRLAAEYPERQTRIMLGDVRISDNPKLNNCVKGWEEARHDWVILADSNVLMTRDYIQRLFAAWRPNTGLVCSTPAGTRPDGFWAEVECVFLNAHQARWQYVGETIGLGFAQGKSMLWNRPFLEQHGGIRALAAEIAEDAASTKLVRAAGKRVHLVDAPFEQPLGPRTLREIWSRQFRWARLRRVTFPLFFAPEIASGVVLPILLGAWWAYAAGSSMVAVAATIIVLWYGAEALLTWRMGWPLSWRMPVAALARDFIIPAMWGAAWVARDVVWRGNAMSIGTKTQASTLAPSSVE
jgi:ceramide glucosyltransferase